MFNHLWVLALFTALHTVSMIEPVALPTDLVEEFEFAETVARMTDAGKGQ